MTALVSIWIFVAEVLRLRRENRRAQNRLAAADNLLAIQRRRYRDLHRQWKADTYDRDRLRRALGLIAQGGFAWKPSSSPVLMAARALRGEDIEDERRKR